MKIQKSFILDFIINSKKSYSELANMIEVETLTDKAMQQNYLGKFNAFENLEVMIRNQFVNNAAFNMEAEKLTPEITGYSQSVLDSLKKTEHLEGQSEHLKMQVSFLRGEIESIFVVLALIGLRKDAFDNKQFYSQR